MIGRTVSHYRILDRLGGGGMGIVYKAQDTRLDRMVALKFLPAEWVQEGILRERFSREARAASSLDHPNICTIFDIGETDDGQLFIAMAHCSGGTLKHRILRGPLAIEDAVEIAIQIADGLENAHEAGIVHRDVKPANILFDDRRQIKIVDFGLAKLAGEAAVTLEGSVVGTPAYMSPEQATGETVDGRSDIWAAGTVLYEMLAGRRAFAASHDRAVLMAITTSDPTPITDLRSEVPAELLRIVGRCLQRDPNDRYQHARELVRDLKRFRGESSPAEIVTQTMPSSMVVRRPGLGKWMPHAAIAAVAVAVMAGLLYPFFQRPEPRHMVVLPFNCPSVDEASRIMCIGLLDTITAKLTEMRRFESSLAVVPVSEVRSQRVVSAGMARQIFGVDLVVSGSVLRERNTLRIPIELIDAARLRQIRSRTITTDDTTDFVMQDQVIAAIEEMLDFEFGSAERQALMTGGTRNVEAAGLYLEARGHAGKTPTEVHLSRAMTLYRQALELDPEFAEAAVYLADACDQRFQLTQDDIWLEHGTTYAQRAVTLAPDLPSAQLAAGRFEFQKASYQNAIDHLQRAIALDPLELSSYMYLAESYRAIGEPERADESVERAIRTGPEDWQTFYDIGRFFYGRHDLEQAVNYFQKSVDLLQENSIGYSALGGSLFYLGRREEARTNLERAVDLGGGYDAYNNLATLEFYEGRYAEAAALYERALDLDDSDYLVWNNYAESLSFGGFEQPAPRDAYARAAELAEHRLTDEPDNPEILIDLASFQIPLGDPEAARDLLGRALDLGIEDPNLMVAAAHTFEKIGDRDSAIVWIGRSIESGYPIGVIEEYEGFAELIRDPAFDRLKAEDGPTPTRSPEAGD